MTFTSGFLALLMLSLGCGATTAGLANAPKLGRTPPKGGPSPDIVSNGLDSCERGPSSRQPAWSRSPPCPSPPSAPPLPRRSQLAPPPIVSTAGLVPTRSWQPHICVSRPLSLDAEAPETCCGWGCASCLGDATPCELFPASARVRP
jgi:hypothetical protein